VGGIQPELLTARIKVAVPAPNMGLRRKVGMFLLNVMAHLSS
jgi:hypothetical protein